MHLSFRDWAMLETDILALHKYITIACCWGLLIITGCSELSDYDQQQIERALQDSLLNVTESWDIDMELMEQGQRVIRLQGSYATTFNRNNEKITRIDGPVIIHRFDSLQKVKTKVTCQNAIYYSETASFLFKGNVHVSTVDDRQLRSETLTWSQADNSISTPDFVIITTPTDSIAGSGFNGTADLSEYQIQNVSGRVYVD